MSSVVRTSQTPYFSFHRSSTPMPYSFGKPTLNCCGGSLSTFGNMKRPVAASAAAEAAENAPHASPIQARRVKSGDVSSGSRVAAFAAAGAVAVRAAAPPGDATFVVLPARSGIGAGAGRGAAGFAACAPAAGVAGGVAPVAAAPGATGLLSSAMAFSEQLHSLRAEDLERLERRLTDLHASIVLAQALDRDPQLFVFQG